MIIDTHAHIYSPDKAKYPVVMNPLGPPAGRGTPEGLRKEMQAAGVDRVMMVQTSTYYGWDNSFLRDTAAASGDWARGVCTLNPQDPHSPDILFALVGRANVRAVRTYPVAGGHFDHPDNRRLFSAARELGITVNVLIQKASIASELARVLTEFPDVPMMLDHCIALEAGTAFDAKLERVIELAKYPNLNAKLTYLGTGSAEKFPFTDMHAPTRQIIDAYGPDRCVWGSDYPTELWAPRATYGQYLELFQEHLGLSSGEQAAILGGTAERLWWS